MWDRLRYHDENVFDRLGHQRQSAFDRLSNTYSPSITKSGPSRASSKDHFHGRGHPHSRDRPSSRNRSRVRDRLRGVEESYGDTHSSRGTRTKYRDRLYDEDRSRSIKKRRVRAARVWFDELPPESIDGYKSLKAAFLAYFMQQKKYAKDPVEIHNIKQRD
ncbi:hypothetical protein Tco_1189227 [Tanacetum coccineum]